MLNTKRPEYLQGVAGGVHAEAEGLVERWLAVMTTHSGLLLDDPFLGGDVHHVQLHVKVCPHEHEASEPCRIAQVSNSYAVE